MAKEADFQSMYLQLCYTLSAKAPTAQSRKYYQRQCTSGWLGSAPLRVEQTALYLCVCTLYPLVVSLGLILHLSCYKDRFVENGACVCLHGS